MTGKDKDDLGIRYLAFEGGGGRGAAYVGAVKALQHHNVIAYKRNFWNISGGNNRSTISSWL